MQNPHPTHSMGSSRHLHHEDLPFALEAPQRGTLIDRARPRLRGLNVFWIENIYRRQSINLPNWVKYCVLIALLLRAPFPSPLPKGVQASPSRRGGAPEPRQGLRHGLDETGGAGAERVRRRSGKSQVLLELVTRKHIKTSKQSEANNLV